MKGFRPFPLALFEPKNLRMKNLYFFIVSLLYKKTDNASFVLLPHTSRVGIWLHSLLLILVFSGSLSATCTTCTGNLLINPGFDVNVNNWASYNGNFFKSTAYPQCGTAAHAEIIHTTGWAGFYQDVTNIPVGNQVTLTFWAGVHNNSVNSLFGLEFYNGSTYLSESTVQIDKILGGSPSMQFYTVTAIVPSNTTKVRVIGKINGDYLKADELCLKSSLPCNHFKSLASSELNLVKTRQVSNEITCVTQPDRVLWIDCLLDNTTGGTSGNLKFWKIVSGGTFKEYCDGTAYVEMTIQNVVNANYRFDVAISFSGRTFTAPSGSPHLDGCTTASSSNWYYYTEMKGSLIGQAGLAGGNISFDRKMSAFQIGTNASLYGTSGTFGASGWFMYDILSHPTGLNFKEDCGADINLFLSGGNLTSTQAAECGKVCAGSPVVLNANAVGGKPNYTYNWSNNLGAGQTKTVNPTGTTTYTVTITDNAGCTSLDAVTINITNSPTVNAGADATICTGSSIILTASGSGGLSPYTYIWNNGLGAGASKTVSPTSNTTYIVTVTDANGCSATDNVTVNIGASPTLTATGTTICLGGSGTISASASGGVAPYTYYWSNGLGTGATKTVNPTVNTTYTVTVEDGNSCTKTATATVTIGGGPTVNVGPDINLCTMDEEIINSTVSNVPSCGQSGTSDCNHVVQGTTGWIEGSASAGICGDNAGSKLWTQSGQGTSSVTLDFGTTVPIGTVICVRMKLEHCQNTNSSLADAKIQRSTSATTGYTDIIASKTFTTTTYTEYCYTLTAASRYIKVLDNGKCAFRVDYVKYTTPDTYNNSITYAWSGPGIVGSTTGASIIVNQSGTYTLVVTDCGGCTASDQVIVTGNGNVIANAGPDQIVCAGQSITLSATEVVGASYEWRTELNGNVIATTRTVSVSPTIATSYILKVTKNGCEATDAVLVTVNPAPTVNVGPDINLCTLDEEIINSVVTNVPSCGQSGTSDCNHVIQGTTGWIEGSASAGVCGDNAGAKLWTKSGQGTSSLTVDFGTTVPVGTVICVRMKLEHCQNSNSNQSDAKIQRSTSATSGYTDVIASKTFTTNSYVEYCYTLNTASRYIKVLDNGKCAFRVDYVKYTTPDTYNNSVTYAWSGPGIVGSTTGASIIVNQSGTYTLVVTDCGGCTASDQVVVTGNGNVEANAGPDQTICTGNSVTLTATEVAGATYEWRSETSETVISNTRTVSVSPIATTSYIVKVMKNGCENSDAVTVNVNNKPTADITGGNQVCTGSSITLTASGAGTGGSYLWSNNATSSSITVSPSANTTYGVTVTNANGCSNTASKAVTVNPLPAVVANNDGPITCIKSSITLTATSATAISYAWSGPNGYSGTGATASPLATVQGQYTVTVTDANGCSATASTTIIQNITPPTANAGADVTVNCTNPSATLTATGGTSYLWSIGATTSSITVSPNVTTTYSVTVTGSNGCTAADAVIVTANKTAPTAAVTANGNNCITENGQLFGSASGGTAPYTYAYTGPNGFTSAVQNPTITQNGTYRLVVTDANGCSDDVDIVIFTQFDPYVITVATDICVGESVTLTASGGVSFQWDANGNNATTNSITVSPLVTTTYAVTITNQNGCVASADATITVFSKPVITNVVATPNASCNNTNNSGTITVSATGQPGLTLQYRLNGGAWQTSNVFNNLPNGTYNVEVSYTNRFCVSSPAQATIQSGAGPVAVAENDKSVCVNAPFNLSATASGATPPYTFTWSNNMTGSNITVSGINANTTYTVTVTDALGCTGTDNVNITIIPGPVSGITGPPTICANEAALFVATPAGVGSTYLWTFDSGVPATASGSSATSQWVTPGEYGITLTVTKNGCISEYTSSIAITQSVFAAAGPDAELCQGGNITLNGSGPVGANFTWTVVSGDPTSIDNGGSASGVLVSPLITTTYRLTVTQNGCTRIDEVKVVVDVNYNPIANAGEDRQLCDDASYIIGGNPTGIAPPQTPNAPLGYIWSPSTGLNNATIANPTLTVNNPGTYNYQVIVFSTLTGCSDTATVNFMVNPRPTVTASASPTTICIDESSVLTAVGAGGTQPYTYAWSNGLGAGASKTVSPTATTTYTVTITDNNGCTASTSVTVTVNPRPTVTASASPSTICVDESSVLTAVGAGGTQPYTYAWSNGLGAGASKTVSPTATTTYTVTITDNKGCTASTSVTVTVNPRPTVTASASPSTICIDESSVLTAVGAGGTQPYTYTWSNGLGAGASKTVSPTATTTYTVTVTDNNGCTASTSVTVTVEPKAKVGDFVWEDKNANGIQDLNEIGIGNVPVSIYNANSNVLVDQTNTLGNGYYEFNVCKGTYYIVFGEYSNYFRTFADKGSDLSDSDANQTTGRTENFTLNPSDNNSTIDAGYYRLASIGDFVWEDIDANGVQGMLENGVPNVEVSITGILNTTNSMGLPILVPPSILLTGPNGEYLFTNLIPGRYTVVVNKPDGYLFSPKDQGGDDTKDSDSDPVTGVMPEETLESGENNLTYDAGIYPEISLEINKTFVSALVQANGTYNVTYNVEVINTGGPGKYDLKDTPSFDDDITINSSSYSSTASGNAGGALAGSGPWTLANDQQIAAFSSHNYSLVVNVTLDLTNGIGNNVYTKCGSSTQLPLPGEGLYNKASVDTNNDGIPEDEDDACGDLPNITLVKDFVSATINSNASYNVTYKIKVSNTGGASGVYTLTDTPSFDNDVTINDWSYFFKDVNGGLEFGSAFPGAPVVPASLGTYTITANNTHEFTLTFNVNMDLKAGSTDGGDNVYTACSVAGNGPGSSPNQGLYNRAQLDRTGDGIADLSDDACGDLPNITLVKDFVSATINNDGTHRVIYKITVANTGGASGNYTLKDSPLFDDDITINAWDYTFVDVNAGFGNGPSFIGAPVIPINFGTKTLTAGNSHIYTLGFNVTLDLATGSTDGGNNIYTPCAVPGNESGSAPNQGLYNLANVDLTGNGVPNLSDDACGDLPNVTMVKNFVNATPNANGSYNVTYQIVVNNNGGAVGTNSLKDTPLFDNDVVINSGSYSGQASGAMNTSGSTTLASNASINAGSTHTYNVNFNVTLNLAIGSPDGGDNIYTSCAVSGNGPGSAAGQGLYNKAELDKTGDGLTDITDDACGDLPNVTMFKNFVSATPNANGSYNVTYQILVNNNGGATGTYGLKDTPLFDNDVVINSGSYSGQASGTLNTTGSTTLASNASIIAGANHVFNLTFNVTLDLNAGSTDGGDNVYTACAVAGNGPGSSPLQGLYNRAELDRNNDGVTDSSDDACGDLPNVTLQKQFLNAVQIANGTYNVTYKITVNNTGGTSGSYSLKDTPLFDKDIAINSGSYTGQASGSLNTVGSTTLASNQSIASGASHVYNIIYNVTLDMANDDLDGGDNVYNPCDLSSSDPSNRANKGLYNKAELDRTGDGIVDVSDDDCGDLPGSIGDFVWEDTNANGVQDFGEMGLPNVIVRLLNQDGVQIAFKVTGPNGAYIFNNLPPATYRVRFEKPMSYIATDMNKGANPALDSNADPITGFTELIPLAAGENNLTIDAGYYKLAKIGDYVWEDRNSNGIQDPLEPGIPNVTVELTGTDARGGVINTSTTTNGVGFYEFANLVPGTYVVRFVKPGDLYKASPANVGMDDAKDSDASIVNGQTGTILLKSGENNNTIDAGFFRCAYVGDYVWLDDNGTNDYVQDGSDVGLNGILVELYSTANPGTPVQSMLTIDNPKFPGQKGYYNFEVCQVGTYFIKVIKPEIYEYVQPNMGLDDSKDSDIIDFINQSTLTFTVTYAAIIDDVDAGLKSKPLPVELLDFTGRYNSNKDVNELTWATASEVNNDYFEIERSFEGRAFESVGVVEGKGNSASRVSYDFTDKDISLNGTYTYRLRQVDFDGRFEYSNLVNIEVSRKGVVKTAIYPNPSVSDVNLDIYAVEGAVVKVDIYDNLGKLVIQGFINEVMTGNVKTSKIESGRLNEGVYYIVVNVDGELSTHKLIIIE